jgi:tetraacyldisaccharide 4'-kinase
VADLEMNAALRAASGVMEAGWEARRRMYALGVLRSRAVEARVVSIGNLSVGGAGKTTLTLHLARCARERSLPMRVVCRRYRPGPAGWADEERLYENALGKDAVLAGRVKRDLAARAARDGARLVFVDDGFSHWALARDLDLVLLDARDAPGESRMLPAGRLREPRRALQRADIVIVSRLDPGEDAGPALLAAARLAPAALLAAGRHAPSGFRRLEGGACEHPGRVRVVTATGNPDSVARTAREAGCEVAGTSTYRDHHWFSQAEARAEIAAAAGSAARVLLTAKDAVRWPLNDERVCVLEVAWQWVVAGDEVERRVFSGTAPSAASEAQIGVSPRGARA